MLSANADSWWKARIKARWPSAYLQAGEANSGNHLVYLCLR